MVRAWSGGIDRKKPCSVSPEVKVGTALGAGVAARLTVPLPLWPQGLAPAGCRTLNGWF